MFFMLGHLTRRLYKTFPLPQWLAWTCLAGVAALLMIQDSNPRPDNIYFYGAVVLFALALPAIFEATKNNKVCNALGDLTYPLYLSGNVFLFLLQYPSSPFHAFGESVTAVALLVSGGVMWVEGAFISVVLWCALIPCAAAVHFLIEKPAAACVRAVLTGFDRLAKVALLHAPRRNNVRAPLVGAQA